MQIWRSATLGSLAITATLQHEGHSVVESHVYTTRQSINALFGPIYINRGSPNYGRHILNCSILGSEVERTFGVRTPLSENVDNLMAAIKKRKQPKFDHIATNELDIWKVNDPA